MVTRHRSATQKSGGRGKATTGATLTGCAVRERPAKVGAGLSNDTELSIYYNVVHWASAGHWENCFCPPSITTTKGNNRSKQHQYIS